MTNRLTRDAAAEDVAAKAEEMITKLDVNVNLDALETSLGELTKVYRREGTLVFTERVDDLPADERAKWLIMWDSVITVRIAEELGVNRADVELARDETTACTVVWVDDVHAFDPSQPPIPGKLFVRPRIPGWCDRTYDVVAGQVIKTWWRPDGDGIVPEIIGSKS